MIFFENPAECLLMFSLKIAYIDGFGLNAETSFGNTRGGAGVERQRSLPQQAVVKTSTLVLDRRARAAKAKTLVPQAP